MPAIPRKSPPLRPFLPPAYPTDRATEHANTLPPPVSLSQTLDGWVVNLAPAMARTLAQTIAAQAPDLYPRAVGYVRDKTLPITVSLVIGDTIKPIRVGVLAEEAARLTLRQLHDQLLAQFWAELDAATVNLPTEA